MKNHRICSAHFEQTDSINFDRVSGKRKLKLKALPAPSEPSTVKVQVDSVEEQMTQSASIASVLNAPDLALPRKTVKFPRKSSRPTRREEILLKKLVTKTAKLKQARNLIRNSNRKTVKQLSVPEIIAAVTPYLDGNRLLLLTMQLNHMKVAPWIEDEKQFALSLFYKSPKAYKFIRDTKGIALPCETLIRKWINETHLTTGISDEVFNMLKIKAQGMSQHERQCVLMWDGMAIKKLLEYNLKDDLVEGLQDLGHLDRSDRVANYVLVFTLRGLSFNWKQPIAFYISHGNVDGKNLCSLLKAVLDATFEAGFIVRSMVCDQGSPNRKAIQSLGITEEKPFADISGHKVFFNFDVPHLIKSVRNNLIKRNFEIGESRISWDAIRELREIERNKSCRAAPKLSDRHLEPNNFERMTVRLASQVFSAIVAAAMTTGQMTGELKNPWNSSTANFVKKMNDIFDCLNSRYANDPNPLKRALSDRAPQVVECLEKALPWIEQWTAIETKLRPDGTEEIIRVPPPPCFAGLRMAIRSTLMFWRDLRAGKTAYLLTTRLNQDPLENLFSVLRARSGNNDNPSAKQFRQNLQYVITMNLERPTVGTNCENDDAHVLLANQSNEDIEQTESLIEARNLEEYKRSINAIAEVEDRSSRAQNVCPAAAESDVKVPIPSEIETKSDHITLEECSKTYVAGYLLHKCLAKFECSNCKDHFVKDNQNLENNNELLLLFKAYKTLEGEALGHLKAPVNKFTTLIVAAYKRFSLEFASHRHIIHLGKYLRRCIHDTLTTTDSDFWLANNDCQEHRDFIVNLFVRMHIFYHLKWISRDIRDAKNSIKRKSGTHLPEKPDRKMQKVTHSWRG